MAIITKYEEQANPDGQGIQYQQSVSITGAGTSDEIVLPPVSNSGFTFSTDGDGTIELSMSTRSDLLDGNGVWVLNDISGGASFTADFMGSFKGASGIRIVNTSGTTSLNIISKI